MIRGAAWLGSGKVRESTASNALGVCLVVMTTTLWLACSPSPASVSESNPLAPPNTSSPRATLTTFIGNVQAAYRIKMAAREAYFESGRLMAPDAVLRQSQRAARLIDRAVRYLDLSEVPPRLREDLGIESAILLKEVLDRITQPPTEAVPGAAEIEALELGRQEPFRWRIPGTELDIARVTEGPRTGEFLFSPQTVARIAADYEKVRALPYRSGASEGFHTIYVRTPGGMLPPRWLTWVGRLPAWSRSPTTADQALYQWIGLALAVLLALAVVLAVRRWSRRIEPTTPVARMIRKLLGPIVVALVAGAVAAFAEELNITGSPLAVVLVLESSVIYLISAWALLIVGNGVAELIISSPRIAPTGLDASFIRLVFRLSAAVASLLVIGYGARQLGLPLPAVIAGLGVGGLAVALAAQPTVENLIGSFSLFADRPVRVGDFCLYGDRSGWVEEIGLRSTQIRGLDRTVTVVPNADFAKTQITNFSRRDRTLLQTTLWLRYETTPDQLRFVLVKLRELLLAHPRILDESLRVCFADLGEYALQVEIFAYVDTTDADEFRTIREDVLLRVMDVVGDAGTGFAFPSHTKYEASSLPADRVEAAEAQVQAWRAAGALPFPEFPSEYPEKVEGTLDYPPAGSPDAPRAGGDSAGE